MVKIQFSVSSLSRCESTATTKKATRPFMSCMALVFAMKVYTQYNRNATRSTSTIIRRTPRRSR